MERSKPCVGHGGDDLLVFNFGDLRRDTVRMRESMGFAFIECEILVLVVLVHGTVDANAPNPKDPE